MKRNFANSLNESITGFYTHELQEKGLESERNEMNLLYMK